jgi:DNA-binding IclR family transcriptional regulator
MVDDRPEDGTERARAVYAAPALEKGLDILELLSASDVGLTQKAIAADLGRSVSEIYRMLSVLVRRGYVVGAQDRFSLTTKMFRMSQAHPPLRRLLREALPIMQDLARQVQFPCDLRVYNRGSQTVIASVETPSGIGFSVRVGAEIDVAPTASGRVLLAFQDAETMELRIAESLEGMPAAEQRAFRRELHDVALRGHASIRSRQYDGLHAVACPILDQERRAIAALTVPMVARIDGVSQLSVPQVELALQAAAARLSAKIG